MFALLVGAKEIAIVLLSILATVALVHSVFVLLTRRGKLHADLYDLSTLLVSRGFVRIGDVLKHFAAGQLVEGLSEAKQLAKLLRDPKTASIVLDDVLKLEIPARLADAAARPQVIKLFADWAKANPEAVKTAGLVISAVI